MRCIKTVVFAIILSLTLVHANLISNGDFSNGETGWNFYIHSYTPVNASGVGYETGGEFFMEMSNPGTESYHGQLEQTGFTIENGKTYEISFDAQASANRSISWAVQHDGSTDNDWTAYGEGTFNVTTSKTNYSATFTMTSATDFASYFNIGVGMSTASVTIDNISISEVVVVNTYTINSSIAGAGSIAPLGATTVNEGASQSYTIAPEDAYASIDSVKVDGLNVGRVTSYTFSNVTANHTIEVFTSRGDCDAASWATGTRYTTDDIVSHNSEEWVSTRNNNFSEPGVADWTSLGACYGSATITVQTQTLHRTGTENVQEVHREVQANLDTIVTTTDYQLSTDTTIIQTDSLRNDVVFVTVYDTTDITIDSVVTNTSQTTLLYTGADVTIILDTSQLPSFDYPSGVVDSVVQPNLDTIVTTSDLQIETWTSVERTRTYVGVQLANTSHDTILVVSDTVVLSSWEQTLPYDHTSPVTPRATTNEPVQLRPSILRPGYQSIEVFLPEENEYRLRVFSHSGDKVLDLEGNCREKRVYWSVPRSLEAGMYLVVLESESATNRKSVRIGRLGIQR